MRRNIFKPDYMKYEEYFPIYNTIATDFKLQKDPVNVPVISKELCDIKTDMSNKKSKKGLKEEPTILKKKERLSLNEKIGNKFVNAIFQNRFRKRMILWKGRKIIWKFVNA